MREGRYADGDILAGARAFLTSVAMNDVVFRVVTIVGPVGAAISWAFVPGVWDSYFTLTESRQHPSMAWPITLTVLGVVAVAVPAVLQLHRVWATKQAAEETTTEQAELVGWVKGYLTPTFEALPQVVVGGEQGRAALASIRSAILGTVAAICGPSGVSVRAVWFEATNRTLSSKEWKGGSSNSQRRFVRGGKDKVGGMAWEVAATGRPVLHRDVINNPPDGYQRGPHSAYGTFITCGVLGLNDEVRGMINVDAPRADDLTDVDATIVGVCAKVLGVAYALSDQAGTVASSSAGRTQ